MTGAAPPEAPKVRLGVVVEQGLWAFFRPLYDAFRARYSARLFQEQSQDERRQGQGLRARLRRWRRARALRALLAESDVVFFEWAGETLARASRAPSRAAIVTRLHSFELLQYAARIQWDSVAAVIVVSNAMQRRLLDRFPACADRTFVVYHGVDLERFAPNAPPARGTIGMLGSVVPIKRVYETVLAVHELRGQGVDVTLRIGGDAPDWGEARYPIALREIVETLGLAERVHFDGQVDEPATWLQGIDIFVSNSYWESQHVAMLEAMACGCHCLAHCWRGVDELLPADHIFVTNSDLVAKVADHLALPDEVWLERRRAMRARAESRFDIRRNVREILAIVDSTAAGRGPSH